MEMLNPEYVSTVERCLKKIDYEIPDVDAFPFYIFILNKHYNCDLTYEYEDYRPPRYFRFLYKWILPELESKVLAV
jgi:hypothetical protein